MKSQHDIRNLDYFLETLDPALLEKLAANITVLIEDDLISIQPPADNLFIDAEAKNGL